MVSWLPRLGVAEPAPPADEYQPPFREAAVVASSSCVAFFETLSHPAALLARPGTAAFLLAKHFFAVAFACRGRTILLSPASPAVSSAWDCLRSVRCGKLPLSPHPTPSRGIDYSSYFQPVTSLPLSLALFLLLLFAATKFSPSCPERGKLPA